MDLQALVAERGQRAGCARELANKDPRLELLQALGMAVEHGQPDRGLVAEGDRQRLLQVGATGHRRIAVLLRQVSEDGAQRRDVFLDNLETGADPQHVGRVHDVLGGGAPVHIAAGVAALFYELMHERQDRIADDVGLVAQEIEVERGGVELGRDLLGRFGRDDAAARLGTRQRDLYFNVARDQGVVGKDLAHASGCRRHRETGWSRERSWRSGQPVEPWGSSS